MSQLKIFDEESTTFKLNVLQFRSPMNASINSVQTKTMLQHFPIRCGQPDINFTVRYASLDDKHAFEGFVRKHMLGTKNVSQSETKGITLWWPERNIENWTGYITNYTVMEKRFETAPAATFGVSLVDSMMSERTTLATRSVDIWSILGIQIPAYQGYDDVLLIKPTPPSANSNPVNTETRPGAPQPPQPLNSGDAPQ